MSKYDNRYEYMKEKTVGWLSDFADREAEKLAAQNNMNVDELKNASYMDNILDIVNRKKKTSVDEKVAKYRELVGLDLVNDTIEKEGGKMATAARIPLSLRDKVAQDANQKSMDDIKQYIGEVIRNRNGVIATPALLEQLEHYMKLDKEWLRSNYEAIEKIIDGARKEFHPQTYNDLQINDLARTDDPSKGENKEPSPFLASGS